MSVNNGKLVTPLSDETERIEAVEKKVNTVVVSLRDLINYTNRESTARRSTSDRLQKAEKTLVKVSHLDKRLQTVEIKQKKSVDKVLIWINFLVSIAILGSSAMNWQPVEKLELKENWQRFIQMFEAVEE